MFVQVSKIFFPLASRSFPVSVKMLSNTSSNTCSLTCRPFQVHRHEKNITSLFVGFVASWLLMIICLVGIGVQMMPLLPEYTSSLAYSGYVFVMFVGSVLTLQHGYFYWSGQQTASMTRITLLLWIFFFVTQLVIQTFGEEFTSSWFLFTWFWLGWFSMLITGLLCSGLEYQHSDSES